MPQKKLTIVPVTLHSESKNIATPMPPAALSNSICMIKKAGAEISFLIMQMLFESVAGGIGVAIFLLSNSICMIKKAGAEISFFHGVDERTIQTVMRELKQL